MKIKTKTLLDALNIISKAASNNKLIPLTQMVGIKVKAGKMLLLATDSTNYLSLSLDVEPFEMVVDVCVNATLFTKLISKFDCEEVELSFNANALGVKGNGDYQLEYLLSETGEPFSFPTKTVLTESIGEVEVSKIVDVKNNNEKSLAVTLENPSLTGYYIAKDKVISTDTSVMTTNNISLGLSEEFVASKKFIELLCEMKEKVVIYKKDSHLYATDGNTTLHSKVVCDLADYPVDSILGLLESAEFDGKVKVNTKSLLSILDRLTLFVSVYDDNSINLKISDSKAFISTKKSKGVEVLELNAEGETKPFACVIDIEMVKEQLSTFKAEEITLQYGNDTFINLIEDKVSKFVCLVEDDA